MITLARPIEDSIQSRISLESYNTFRFAYYAEYFAIANTLEELSAFLKWANKADIAVTVIGGGSNLLIEDNISGLVIINRLSGISDVKKGNGDIILTASAGENWHDFVEYTVRNNWFGVENLALIPGTVGAAPVQNIGAYGVEVKDCITRVQVIDKKACDVSWLDNQECHFAYRDSKFKNVWQDKYIITAVEFCLKLNAPLQLNYGGLIKQIEGEPSLQKVFEVICKIRSEKLPDPKKLANAGSFFKNPIVSLEKHDSLKSLYPDLVSFPFAGEYKLAAGWLIDQAGWKGVKQQGVGVYPKQALVLVNYSEQQAEALLTLETQIQKSVLDKYGVVLEREPVRLPKKK